MVQKPTVRNWHREEFAKGKKDAIPAAALAQLEAEEAAKKSIAEKKSSKPDKETKAE